jgi:trans-2,3-dihydro-3-hydroxyanthranilate isomerase
VPLSVSIVNACLRDGRGGSPTVVVDDNHVLTDAESARLPVHYGTSHAVVADRRRRQAAPGESKAAVDLRFFTPEGELPACGHGTVAALAFLAHHSPGTGHEFRLRVSGRTFTGRAVHEGDSIRTEFDPGPIALRSPTPPEIDLTVAALGVAPDLIAGGACVASLGRARLLLPVTTAGAVAGIAPNVDRLRAACDRLDLLGCYVYSVPTSVGRVAARMFAPSIGVPEDVANANSTACLAVHLAGRGVSQVTVDMGDTLGSPATITASAHRTPTGVSVLVGAVATIARTETL